MGNHNNPRVASCYPDRSDEIIVFMIGSNNHVVYDMGLAITYDSDEIRVIDKRDISWEYMI